MHYRKALESLLLHDFTCHLAQDDYPPDWPRRILITLRGSMCYDDIGKEVVKALHIATCDRARMAPITAADLGLAERLAVARDTIATATPEQLAELAVCVDAAISGRGVAEYRSPTDVARIAELEGL
jgi:hypothetical protein